MYHTITTWYINCPKPRNNLSYSYYLVGLTHVFQALSSANPCIRQLLPPVHFKIVPDNFVTWWLARSGTPKALRPPKTGWPFWLYNTPAMTYFHMGRPHTIIGSKRFHFRVRDGIGWYPLAIVAGRTGWLCCYHTAESEYLGQLN